MLTGDADRCMVLEGDEGYRCWEALSEFENIKVVLQSRNLCSIMLLQPLVVPSCALFLAVGKGSAQQLLKPFFL